MYDCYYRLIRLVSEVSLQGHVSSGPCKVLSPLTLGPPPQNPQSVEFCFPLSLLPEGLPADGGWAWRGNLSSSEAS